MIKINFRILILFILSSCISNDDSFIPGQTETGNQTNYPEIQYGLNDYDIVFQGINRYFNIYVPQNYQHELLIECDTAKESNFLYINKELEKYFLKE